MSTQVLAWYHLAAAIAPLYGIPPELACALIYVESNGKPDAVSSAGAVGLMQVMPSEAGPVFRDRPQARWLREPAINIAVGCSILRGLVDYYGGDFEYAIMAYFAGAGNVPKNQPVTYKKALDYLNLVKDRHHRLFPLSRFFAK